MMSHGVWSHVSEEDLPVGGAGDKVLTPSQHHTVIISECIVVWILDRFQVSFRYQVPVPARVYIVLAWRWGWGLGDCSNLGFSPRSPWRYPSQERLVRRDCCCRGDGMQWGCGF